MPDTQLVDACSRRTVLRRAGQALGAAGLASHAAAADTAATSLDESQWTERRVLTIGHRGGLLEVPENTLFALKHAAATGVNMMELDLKPTAGKTPVVNHDRTVDRTTDGSGRVDGHTLAELKALDAAYWFVEGEGTTREAAVAEYDYRGYATGDRALPPGLGTRHGFDVEPNDFRIPTLAELLEVADTREAPLFLTISLPTTQERNPPYTLEREVAVLMKRYDRVGLDVVAAFDDAALERFKAAAPAIDTATATARTAGFWASARDRLPGAPQPRYEALQVPLTYEGLEVVDRDFVRDAHANGLAVHPWVINDRETMQWLVDICVDGIMTDRPTALRDLLEARGLAHD
jgi:glycerophosphoryl diester phosphodiesterase